MTVTLVSHQLRNVPSFSFIVQQRLQRFVVYVWIIVITLHNISIVSNSALNPSLIITTATTTGTNNFNYIKHSKRNMFRTVLSSSTRGGVSTTPSGTALELLPLHPVSLMAESSSSFHEQQPLSSILTSTSFPEEEGRDDQEAVASNRRTLKTKQLRSPLKSRFGLFRRKLMMMDDDGENDTSSLSFNNNTSTPPPSTTMLAATTVNIAFINNSNMNHKSKLSIGSLFRGGATATNPVVESGHYYGFSIRGAYMILSKLFQTIFVQNFCQFANFIGTTKTRCFCLLVFSVFIESYATTLSKQAKDTGNALLFARACLVYLFWYVTCRFCT
jgi:hypothetical protein